MKNAGTASRLAAVLETPHTLQKFHSSIAGPNLNIPEGQPEPFNRRCLRRVCLRHKGESPAMQGQVWRMRSIVKIFS